MIDKAACAHNGACANPHTLRDDGVGTNIATIFDDNGRIVIGFLPMRNRPFDTIVRVDMHARRDTAMAANREPTAAIENAEWTNEGMLAHLDIAKDIDGIIAAAIAPKAALLRLLPSIYHIF